MQHKVTGSFTVRPLQLCYAVLLRYVHCVVKLLWVYTDTLVFESGGIVVRVVLRRGLCSVSVDKGRCVE